MDGKGDNVDHGSFLATGMTAAGTYLFGSLLDASGWLALVNWLSHITPGQASLAVGGLGLLFQVVKWLVERRDRRRPRPTTEEL